MFEYLVQVIVVLGFAGSLSLMQQLEKKVATGIALHSMHIGAPKWQLARAARFARMIWRDKVDETLEERKLRLGDFFYKLKVKNEPIGAVATLRLAAMSATFILIANACIGEEVFQRELQKSYEIFFPLWKQTLPYIDPNKNYQAEFKKEVMVSVARCFNVLFCSIVFTAASSFLGTPSCGSL